MVLVSAIPLAEPDTGRSAATSGATRVLAWRRRAIPFLTVLLVTCISVASLGGFLDTTLKQKRQNELLARTRGARVLQLTLIDADASVRGYLLTGRLSCLQPYYAALASLQGEAQVTIAALDDANIGGSPGGHDSVSRRVGAEMKLWEHAIALGAGNPAASIALTEDQHDNPLMDRSHGALSRYIEDNLASWQRHNASLAMEQDLLLIGTAAGGFFSVLALIFALYRGGRETARRDAAMQEAVVSREAAIAGREEVRQVFAMAEALQSAAGLADGAAILRASALRLMPSIGGALYVYNNSRDKLDLALAWHGADDSSGAGFGNTGTQAAPFLIPSECWALKRAKPHLNGQGPDALRCCHAPVNGCSLEVPMVGRGEPVGMLVLHAAGHGAEARLIRSTDIACVLADSMSLALSSIMLRDKLRNQAVRDSLTGLYNRRFLEEMLQSLSLQAQRRHSSLAAIMIDLDHFKRLNDDHGHAMGDTILKAAAAAVVSTLRASDVACRYGGEELVVLLPDCTGEAALAKAEQIRERIFRLSRDNGPQVSASCGVSCMPGTARESTELLSSADAALYKAKQQGRDQVVMAPMLAPAETAWRGSITLGSFDVSSLCLDLPARQDAIDISVT